jgi:hypothetical protein
MAKFFEELAAHSSVTSRLVVYSLEYEITIEVKFSHSPSASKYDWLISEA